MAIDDLSALKTALVTFYKNRSDISANADTIISLAEGMFNTELRCREMETVTSLTPVSNVCTLPSDYLEYKRVVEVASIRRPLDYITEDAADTLYPTRCAGLACHFSIVGNSLTAFPLSSNDIELTYYKQIPALTEANKINWLLTRMPNLYLHTCLMYAAELTKDEEQFAKEAVLAKQMLSSLQSLDNRAKFGNAGVTLTGIY